jgi:hypothetical protein
VEPLDALAIQRQHFNLVVRVKKNESEAHLAAAMMETPPDEHIVQACAPTIIIMVNLHMPVKEHNFTNPILLALTDRSMCPKGRGCVSTG